MIENVNYPANRVTNLCLVVGHDEAVKGVTFAVSLLRYRLPPGHTLLPLLTQAEEVTTSSPTTGRFSPVVHRVARWGLQLEAIQDWTGFAELVRRIVSNRQDWLPALHEATIAWMFKVWGFDGRLYLDTSAHRIPDLRVERDTFQAVVECRRSEATSAVELKDHDEWQAAADLLVGLLRGRTAVGILRITPRQSSSVDDKNVLAVGVEQLIGEHEQSGQAVVQHTSILEASGRTFDCQYMFADQPNEVFETLRGRNRGIAVPDDLTAVEPGFVALEFAGTEPPQCSGLWMVTFSHGRSSDWIVKRLLKTLDDKVTQLNAFRRSGHSDAGLPGIVWIHHPTAMQLTRDELDRLHARVQGKFKSNQAGRLSEIAGVMLSVSRLLIDKRGILYEDFQLSFSANPRFASLVPATVPLISQAWWLNPQEGITFGEVPPDPIWP